jgi:hypothetical protein
VALSLLVASGNPTKLLQTQNTTLHYVALHIIRFHKHYRATTGAAFLLALLPLVTPFGDQMLLSPTP